MRTNFLIQKYRRLKVPTLAALLALPAATTACAQSSSASEAGFNERFRGLRRAVPVFTYQEVTSRLPPMPLPSETGGAPRPANASSAQVSRPRPIETGRATWYQHSGRTASGEVYNPDRLTAAHRSLPFGKRVLVVNTRNGRSVVVRITDRTNARMQARRPYVVDLSRGSARAIGIEGVGQVALYEAR